MRSSSAQPVPESISKQRLIAILGKKPFIIALMGFVSGRLIIKGARGRSSPWRVLGVACSGRDTAFAASAASAAKGFRQ